jgi:hypothetical protein
MRRTVVLAALLLFVPASIASLYAWFPAGYDNDWLETFYPAARALLSGRSPYDVDQFMLAPWSLVLFAPLALLPARLGLAVLTVCGISAYGWTAYKLGARPLAFVALLLSPQILIGLLYGNVDWISLLGFVLPPQIGLFCLAVKPQIGAPLIVYWLVEAIRERRLVRTFAPFAAACLLACLLTGWPLHMGRVQMQYNYSLWPASIPFGAVLLLAAVRRHRERIAQGIGPLLSPHVMFHSWAAPLYALAPDTLELVAAVAASWGMALVAIAHL